jgi:hypothetical protein
MKAILSLIIVSASINAFAQSAETRAEFQMFQRVKEAKERAACEAAPEACQRKAAVENEIARLREARSKVAIQLTNAKSAVYQTCANTAIRTAERMSVDGVVKYVNYTPCEKIAEYNENSKPHLAKVSSLSVQLRALDAKLAEKDAEHRQLRQEIYNH